MRTVAVLVFLALLRITRILRDLQPLRITYTSLSAPCGRVSSCAQRRANGECVGSFHHRLIKGVRRHPYRTLLSVFVVYGTSWAILEPLISFLDLTASLGAKKYVLLVVLALLIGVLRMAIPRSADIKIPGTNSTVHISEGDLVSFDGHRIVSANEYFDCQLGTHVAKESIHGQIIDREFGGSADAFGRVVDAALEGIEGVDENRPTGRAKRYPVGTTAPVKHGAHVIFLAALSHTDVKTLKATATSADLWLALRNAWSSVRIHGNGRPVALGLMGTGVSGIGFPYVKALEFILLSLLDESKRGSIPTEIHVVAPAHIVGSMDLGTLEKGWQL